MLGLVFLEIRLVLDLLDLLVSDLLDLVMVDHEDLTIMGLVVESLLGGCSSIWLLEANKGVGVSGLSFLKSDFFDLTILLEEISEVIISPGSWEVLDVEIASLLGGLVSNGVSGLLELSLSLLEGMSDVKLHFVTLGILAHNSVLELGDGLLAALWSIFLVLSVFVVIADKSILSDFVLEENKRFDGSKWSEDLSNLGISHLSRNILEIDVVDQFSHGSSDVLWLEVGGSHDIATLLSIDGLLGSTLINESDEAIAS